MSELSPISLSVLPAETTLQLHGEAILGDTEALCCDSSQSGPFLASGCRNGRSVIYRVPDSLGSTEEAAQLHPVYEVQPEVHCPSTACILETLFSLPHKCFFSACRNCRTPQGL